MATCVHCRKQRRTMDQSLRQGVCEHRGCCDKRKCRSLCSIEDLSQHCCHDSESLVRSSTLVGFEDLSWNDRTSTPPRSETDGIAERAVGRVKEGTSAVG